MNNKKPTDQYYVECIPIDEIHKEVKNKAKKLGFSLLISERDYGCHYMYGLKKQVGKRKIRWRFINVESVIGFLNGISSVRSHKNYIDMSKE